ncbi:unnamed protein product (macronuclear) [Paramecium tetraurelia]|uniref:Uncharacterized protein n=1 Tax=Paramecium tetraurelia TaxID=5888 RepID=A0BGW9_PARTE|nr:uncharacterized protein GSPATT00028821001 [Paramecium tetraurelia]CAK57786.1 unnamed protein product [Paramecium tetraurelia]|eukprot:XP_001425184.1 hypothetical protein (macronuclear) [Paramecium tetraurelia strain d4-2]
MNSSQSSFTDLNDWALIYQNLQKIQPEQLSSKLNLLFKNLPDFNDFIKLYECCKIDTGDLWNQNEELLLQLIVLSLNPKCMKNRFNWERVQRMMPKFWSLPELYFKFQSFYKPLFPRQPWSTFEERTLLQIILYINLIHIRNNSSRCKMKWSTIAYQYNRTCKSEIQRNAKQCRERWNNKLDPQINRDPWSKSEELNFLQLLLQNGRKWTEISMKLSMITNQRRRTEFALKHKFKQLKKYYGLRAKRLCDLKVSPHWNIQEADMISYKIELLEEITKKGQTQKYSFCEFWSFDHEQCLVFIKNGSLMQL